LKKGSKEKKMIQPRVERGIASLPKDYTDARWSVSVISTSSSELISISSSVDKSLMMMMIISGANLA
jgi:hypothetical protein